MNARLVNPQHTSEWLETTVRRILAANLLCTMSTIGDEGGPHIFTTFFSFDDEFVLHFLSHPESTHARHLRRDPRLAVAICDQRQPWGAAAVGLQIFGRCTLTPDDGRTVAEGNYAARFPLYVDFSRRTEPDGTPKPHAPFFDLRFYTFRPETVKILHEPDLGEQGYVTASVSARV